VNTPAPATRLLVDYFDGLSARAHRVSMWIENDMLQLAGRDLIRQVPLAKVQWPERTRHGFRQAHFADGGQVQALDAQQWDTWANQHGLGDKLVVRAQQSWRWTLLATVLLLLVTGMGYWWGLPLAARALSPLIPASVDKEVGEATLQAMDGQWLSPSRLPEAEQAQWRAQFAQAVLASTRAAKASGQHAPAPDGFKLAFRRARIGPNAFALPGGTIVLTDEIVALLGDRPDVLLGVLGHEMGHVTLRHGMRALIQTGLLGAASSVLLGDFSTVLAGAPALLGHMAYSRDLEREADEASIAFMRANHIKPSVMATFFERLAQARQSEASAHQKAEAGTDQDQDTIGIAFSSHPADAERIARFKAADAGEATDPAR